MVMVRVNTTQNLNIDPNPQNGIVEGHPNQIRTQKKDASGCANHWYCYFAFDIGKIEGDNLRHDIAELVDVDPESNTTTKFIMPVLEKNKTPASVRTVLYNFQVNVLHRTSTCAHVSLLVYSIYCW